MKRIIAAILFCTVLTSCKYSNSNGRCVGPMNQNERETNTEYEASFWNMFMGIIFIETIIVPVVVFGYASECPKV